MQSFIKLKVFLPLLVLLVVILGPLALISNEIIITSEGLISISMDAASAIHLPHKNEPPELLQSPTTNSTWQVENSVDDTSISVNLASSYLTNDYISVGYVSLFDLYSMSSGFRFGNITIPQRSIITNASLMFIGAGESATETSTRIYGEKSADPSVFSDGAGGYTDFINRNRTTEYTSWVISHEEWDLLGFEISPSITNIIQELIDAYDYNGDEMVLFWQNYGEASTDYKQAYQWDYDPPDNPQGHFAPWLFIEWFQIENAPGTYNFGAVELGDNSNTAIDHFTVSNTGDTSIDIIVQALDLTGGNDTWTLSNTATAGENIYGMKVGLDDADDNFDIIVKKSVTFNELVNNLAGETTQDWGLQLIMPTTITDYDNQEMSTTLTLVGSLH